MRWPSHENDRAQTERETEGFVKVVTDGKGDPGRRIVGAQAGELIQIWCLAIAKGLKTGAGAVRPPYPTLGEVSKRAAGSYFTDRLFFPLTRKLVSLLQRLPVW